MVVTMGARLSSEKASGSQSRWLWIEVEVGGAAQRMSNVERLPDPPVQISASSS